MIPAVPHRPEMRRIILRNQLSPGDVVVFTAAIRDLHHCYPGAFETDVQTSCPEVWENNPYLTPLELGQRGVEQIDCECPLINQANSTPYHCLHGYLDFLNTRLGLTVRPGDFKGDIHLSAAEKLLPSPMELLCGVSAPYWLLSAGGKYDLTIKWWDAARYQRVIDHFRGRLQFVQVGRVGDYHPKLEGVIDLRGKTTLRQLIRLVYRAQGVLCGVTALMHLAAAVEQPPNKRGSRPCVVVAGGREPSHWEAYPGHRFLHTIGALSCCASGGCWRSRTNRLGDGDPADRRGNLCLDTVGHLPKCMDLIQPGEVIRAIESYFAGSEHRYLNGLEAAATVGAVEQSQCAAFDQLPLTVHSVRTLADRFIRSIPLCPPFSGRGIVICAGGTRYFTNAWVCVNMLRRLGCSLPIQMWHLGPEELDVRMRALVAPLGVECVDALELLRRHPARMMNGWVLKPYALVHCPYREVLLLDADNVPLVNPEFLFEGLPFKRHGAVFWPDFDQPDPPRAVWEFCGARYRREPPFETGQILLDKQRCWRPLALSMWFNENCDFFYRHVHGDKETFHLAFRRLGHSFAMPAKPMRPLKGVMCQHDFDGRRIFQHRNAVKWEFGEPPKPVRGFRLEQECRACLAQLARLWNGRVLRSG